MCANPANSEALKVVQPVLYAITVMKCLIIFLLLYSVEHHVMSGYLRPVFKVTCGY